MTSGGARARSGPAPDPNSARSERRGLRLTDLPQTYVGVPPKYPLKKYMLVTSSADGGKETDKVLTRQFATRERQVWKWLWSMPQANAWSLPQYSYLLPEIALYCRQYVICESPAATSADRGLLPRYADRIGLSNDGMARLGWRVRPDQIAEKRLQRSSDESDSDPSASRPKRRVIKAF